MTTIRRGTGCCKAPFDSRDYQFSTLVASAALSKRKFPKEYISKKNYVFYDQGETSMCCACAIAGSRYIQEDGDAIYSPCYIYGNRCDSVVIDGKYEGEGMFLKDALKQLINSGICKIETLNNFGTYQQCKNAYIKALGGQEAYERSFGEGNSGAPYVIKEAYPNRVSSYYAVNTDQEIMTAIMDTGCVLASYMITSGWYEVDETGIIPTYGNLAGGHAVLIVGWKVINDKKYWVILNSWSREWGDHGFGYMDVNESKSLLEAYCILDNVTEAKYKLGEKGDVYTPVVSAVPNSLDNIFEGAPYKTDEQQ